MARVDRTRLRAVRWVDHLARVVITAGGILVIGSVVVIVALIAKVALPLLQPAVARLRVASQLPVEVAPGDVVRLGVDLVEIRKGGLDDALSAYALTKDGRITFFEFAAPDDDSRPVPEDLKPAILSHKQLRPPTEAKGQTVVYTDQSGGGGMTLLWSDGSVSLVEATADALFDDLGRRTVRYRVNELANLLPEKEGKALQAVARAGEQGAATCALLLSDNRVVVRRETVEAGLFGEGEKKVTRTVIDSGIPGPVAAMTLSRQGNVVHVGTANGYLARFTLDDSGRVVQRDAVSVPGRPAVTALTMVFGDVSLAVGGADGSVTTWFPVRSDEGDGDKVRERFVLAHHLSSHEGEVREILPSQRNKSLLTVGRRGDVVLDYMTSERRLLTLGQDRPLEMVAYSPRGNAVVGLDRDKALRVWQIDCPHPEVSWSTLFGKVWYENHEGPKYMWQSSGTDEPKLSLVPIIFGTLKATIYAMLFAVPLALASAMYVSHFTTPGFKRAIKPVVEVMAAIPTVVVGFLVLLWGAPLVGRWIVGVFVGMVAIPVTFALFLVVWQPLRRFEWTRWLENGYEFLVLAPVIVAGCLAAVWATGPVEGALFDGDFRQWLFDHHGLRYDQLNALVVAFGLGFAVIPIIFSISEDSLSDIPHSLTAASLALGASRWQTVWRVILPSASPGIFAAVMIGFGRAVGETMIVFMATGNTPILDWSPFNGFRTLSANIAVEISEAEVDGTLYRVLFLCAVVLFLLTFVLNTAAETVRVRLRKKYGRY